MIGIWCALPVLFGPGLCPVKYSMLDLSALPGCFSGEATAVNASGQVVGNWSGRGFLYANGKVVDLGDLGEPWTYACDLNDLGQVVGYSVTPDEVEQAFLYSNGVMSNLGAAFGEYTSSYAQGVNDSGQVVGVEDYQAFLCANGAVTMLGSLGRGDSTAMAVNASGQIVGIVYGGAGSPTHAFLYSNGAMSDLGTLPGFDCSYAESINSRGQVVGTSQDSSGNLHAFLWSNGVMSDLGMPLGFTWSDALSINTAGQVVGCGGPPDSYSRSFFCSGGCMYDLTGLLDASGAGWTIETAACINDSGQIAGTATIDGWDAHAVLLTPDAGVTGSVKLQDFSGDVTQVPVTVQVRLPGTTDAMQTRTVNLDSSGTFSIPSALTGVFDVSVKASHWLRRTIHGVTFAGDGYVSGLTFTLVDGDVNGDNTVNLPDLIEIAAAWRSTPGSPNWNPNADLNGDGTVDLADWLIVARNWRASGDP